MSNTYLHISWPIYLQTNSIHTHITFAVIPDKCRQTYISCDYCHLKHMDMVKQHAAQFSTAGSSTIRLIRCTFIACCVPFQQFGLQNSRYLFLLLGKEEVERSLPTMSDKRKRNKINGHGKIKSYMYTWLFSLLVDFSFHLATTILTRCPVTISLSVARN